MERGVDTDAWLKGSSVDRKQVNHLSESSEVE